MRQTIHALVEWAINCDVVEEPGFSWQMFLEAHGCLYRPERLRLQIFDHLQSGDSGIESSSDEEEYQPSSDEGLGTDDSE